MPEYESKLEMRSLLLVTTDWYEKWRYDDVIDDPNRADLFRDRWFANSYQMLSVDNRRRIYLPKRLLKRYLNFNGGELVFITRLGATKSHGGIVLITTKPFMEDLWRDL